MSEQIIAQLTQANKVLLAKEKTYQQVVQEYLSANINLRASNVLQEESINELRNEIEKKQTQVILLEKDKEGLEIRLEEYQKSLKKK